MDHISLLCDEVWLSSPASDDTPVQMTQHGTKKRHDDNGESHMTKEEFEQAFTICLEEEKSHIPKHDYLQYLVSNNLIVARFRSIQCFIKCRSRFNLSFGTVFYATNYLDRFISMNQYCNIEWKYWMVELLCIACLSIASKFIDTTTPTLHEINQIEDMEHLFEASTIQRMELKVLEALDWRLACNTPHSYVQLFIPNLQYLTLDHLHQQHSIITQLFYLLLGAISDTKLVEFRPSVIAVSALWCCLGGFLSTSASANHDSCLTGFFDKEEKDDLVRCHKIMMEMHWINGTLYKLEADGEYQYNYGCPSSPTTVLLKERNSIRDFNVDLSPFQKHPPRYKSCIKIKEEAEESS
ncbi:Cyclin [Trema orientale]|uniref:B-like cyclin n=1 Tax=Trema orientale TaxID=63057 RepID=A0A2P5EZ70_TREOI|nr:Cyclin [Trema orientale]